MVLFINTASSEIITLALLDKKGEVLIKKNIQAKYKQSEKLLAGIDKLIGNRGKLKELTGVIVVKGPGSFTALRIGLTTANTIAFGLGIPVAGVMDGEFKKIINEGIKKLDKIKVDSYEVPEYGMEPNITMK